MLRQRAISGAKWTTLSAAATGGLQVVQFTVLAWILARADFGLMSMTMVVVGLGQMLADLGIGAAIIQRQQSSADELSSLYWLNVLAGVILFGALFAAAPIGARLFAEPRLTELIRLASFSLLIIPIGQQFEVLLQRDLGFRQLAGIEVGSAAIGLGVALSVALSGGGASSLVWAQLASNAAKASALAVTGARRHRIRFSFNHRGLRGYLAFGLYQIGERLVNYATARVDVVLIGRYLGADVLGVYFLACQVVLAPLARVNPVLTRVAFPVFARRQANAQLRHGYVELIRLLSILVFPALVGLALTAPVAIPVLLGEKWAASAAIVPVLAIIGLAKALANPTGIVVLAKGRPEIGFWWQVCAFLAYATAFHWAVKHGLGAMIWTYVALSLVNLAGSLILLRLLLGLDWGEYLSAIRLSVAASIAMGAALAGTYALWPDVGANLAEVLALVAVGGAVYVLALYVLGKSYLYDVYSLARAPRRVP